MICITPAPPPQKIAARDQRRIKRRQSQQLDLVQFQSRMQPRTVRAEQDLVRPRATRGLLKQVVAAHAQAVRMDIRVAHKVVDQRQQFGRGHLPSRVVRHGHAEEARRIAHCAADARV
ncbi:hypothetical protein [Janthinobacterium sp. OK676]|uniref:hypothetical protein n=1 Tax=Janthinobacterium sp. OK676 TaxID=1855295 RepID=UPI000B84DD9D|nr:hypothetical protein [Janthinobacterium sp. OK676]